MLLFATGWNLGDSFISHGPPQLEILLHEGRVVPVDHWVQLCSPVKSQLGFPRERTLTLPPCWPQPSYEIRPSCLPQAFTHTLVPTSSHPADSPCGEFPQLQLFWSFAQWFPLTHTPYIIANWIVSFISSSLDLTCLFMKATLCH